jgi:hypothetical protein
MLLPVPVRGRTAEGKETRTVTIADDLLDDARLSLMQAVYNGVLFADPTDDDAHPWVYLIDDGTDDLARPPGARDADADASRRRRRRRDQRRMEDLVQAGAVEFILGLPCLTDEGMAALRRWPAASMEEADR